MTGDDVEIDARWLGDDYGVPTAAGDEAIRWAAAHGGWVLDRTYSGKGFAGLLGNAAEGRWAPGAEVVFLHTGGSRPCSPRRRPLSVQPQSAAQRPSLLWSSSER